MRGRQTQPSILGWSETIFKKFKNVRKIIENQKDTKKPTLGPCPRERTPNLDVDSRSESSVRPNGTPVMSILRIWKKSATWWLRPRQRLRPRLLRLNDGGHYDGNDGDDYDVGGGDGGHYDVGDGDDCCTMKPSIWHLSPPTPAAAIRPRAPSPSDARRDRRAKEV